MPCSAKQKVGAADYIVGNALKHDMRQGSSGSNATSLLGIGEAIRFGDQINVKRSDRNLKLFCLGANTFCSTQGAASEFS